MSNNKHDALKEYLAQYKGMSPLTLLYIKSMLNMDAWYGKNRYELMWKYSYVFKENVMKNGISKTRFPKILTFDDCMLAYDKVKTSKKNRSVVRDKDGKIRFTLENVKIIPFEGVDNLFVNNMAIVMTLQDDKQEQYGLINHKGEYIAYPQYDEIDNNIIYSDEKAFLFIKYKGKYGFYEMKTGKKIHLKYDHISVSDEKTINKHKYFQCFLKNKTGYVSPSDGLKIKPEYDLIADFENGLAIIRKGMYYGAINGFLKVVLEPKYLKIDEYEDRYAIHNQMYFFILQDKNEKYGIYDPELGITNKFSWDEYIIKPSEHIISFRESDKFGIFNAASRLTYYPEYDYDWMEVISLDVNDRYFCLSNKTTGKYALAGLRFNLLTDFIFNHPLEYYSNFDEFVVYLKKDHQNEWINRIEYKNYTFIKLFGINGKNNFLKSEPEAFIKVTADVDYSFDQVSVAGTGYQNKKRIISEVKVNDEVILIPEPENKYDPNAIAVFKILGDEKLKIGYIPKEICQSLKTKMGDNDSMPGIVTYIGKNWNWPEVNIDVNSVERK